MTRQMTHAEGTATGREDPSSVKVVFDGTHRSRLPEETWQWIQPKLPRLGITRVAEVTWLDEIGIPVFQAVRPNALTLSVSQGKGMSKTLARVSAAMEAVELWHAENPLAAPTQVGTVDEVERVVGYRVQDLPLTGRHHLNPDTTLSWRTAHLVDSAGTSLVPADLLRLDYRFDRRWLPPLFRASSNGLASGNTRAEALLHGMYETVERDAMARAASGNQPRAVDPETVGNAGLAALLERYRAARVHVRMRFLDNPFGIPVFDARIWSDAFPATFAGAGAHLDAAVALSRALTEAAQSRATAIAGARDDIGKAPYREARVFGVRRSSESPPFAGQDDPDFPFDAIESSPLPTLDEEVEHVAKRIREVTGHAPLYVDLTQPDIAIPVVHVVCPGTSLQDH
ncbi:YcaO-like family protein [Amycolatopsis sp. cmx-4-61]|uniref:YcaO-like family protein n=1 Tax=Amycolatopsis sp. cmx-4-61 TaxID=2790937 RepID=UPI003978BC39